MQVRVCSVQIDARMRCTACAGAVEVWDVICWMGGSLRWPCDDATHTDLTLLLKSIY